MLEWCMVSIGIVLIAVALAANPWTVPGLFDPSTPLSATLRTLIGIGDLALAGIGIFFLKYRNDRTVGGRAILTACALTASVLLFEVFLRVQPASTPSPSFSNFSRGGIFLPIAEANGSVRLRPHLNINWQIDSSPVALRTNSRGLAGRDMAVDKPTGTARVAFVGDSFTFGFWADSFEHSFVGVFDKEMTPSGFDVLNFGVPGFGLKDIERQLESDVQPFQPDYIVLASFNGNDFMETYLDTDRHEGLASGRNPNREEIGEKVPLEFQEPWNLRQEMLERIRLYGLIRDFAKRVFPSPSPGRLPDRWTPNGSTYRSQGFWQRADYPPFAERARDVSLESLENIRRFCDHNGVVLLIVTIPFLEQVYFADDFRNGYDVHLPQKYVEQFAADHSIAYLDLQPPLTDYVRRTGATLYFQQDGHFNTEGHAVAGMLVTAFFKAALQENAARVRS